MREKRVLALQFFAEEPQGEAAVHAGQEAAEESGRQEERQSREEIPAEPECREAHEQGRAMAAEEAGRERQEKEERLKKLDQAMAEIEKSYGMDSGQEPEKLLETIRRERRERENRDGERLRQAKQQLDSLLKQAEALRRVIPDFDLAREMENPRFLRLTAPHTGLSLEDAYYAVHYREIGERLARDSMLSAVEAVRAGSLRPSELRGSQSASAGAADPRHMTREQRAALKKRIYEARAQGRKLPYGS